MAVIQYLMGINEEFAALYRDYNNLYPKQPDRVARAVVSEIISRIMDRIGNKPV